MKKYLTVVITMLLLVAFLAAGCTGIPSPAPAPGPQPGPAPAPAPAPSPGGGEDNFRLLISDEVNAIEDFEHLYVTISSIGVHQGGESGVWHVLDPEPDPDGDGIDGLDLKPLTGPNAIAIWSGTLPDGEYTKVFIHVDSIQGILIGGDEIEMKLPSNKLQISKPFTISDSVVEFVYDITVVQAGKSGKYVLKPQIAESGAEQEFNELKLKAGEGEEDEESESELELRLQGEPALGAEVVLLVMDDDVPVEGAIVTLNDVEVGSTDADGQLAILLPETAGEIEIEATLGDKSGEIELELEEEEGAGAQWFEGTILALSEGEEYSSPWTMTLEGVEGEVTVHVVELEGTPAVGARAEIQGVLLDGIIEDAEAEIEEEEEAEAQKLEGTIISISEGEENSSPWVMNLEGIEGEVTVHVTEMEGTPAVGAHAEIEGVLLDGIIEDAEAEIEEE
jgi:hypothetical protein